MLTSATRGEMPTPDPNEFNFTLTSVIKGYLYYIQYIYTFREMFSSTAQTGLVGIILEPRRAETGHVRNSLATNSK